VGALAIVTSVADWGRSALGPLGGNPEAAVIAMRVCRGVALVLLVAACTVAVIEARADLVEARRRARIAFVVVIALVFTALAGSEFVFGGQGAPAGVRVAGMALLLVLAFALVQAASRGWLDEVLAGAPARSTPALVVVATEAPATGLARRVLDEMASRELWRRERLGIAVLAAELGTQEYLLRRAINRELGYRNFNDFLHDYRLREAARHLADPGEKRPVLSIALDCGYGSIGPFNRAFKARFGVTPTQYRGAGEQTRAVSGIGATGA
jgi:AraC-like DNA-binding protein